MRAGERPRKTEKREGRDWQRPAHRDGGRDEDESSAGECWDDYKKRSRKDGKQVKKVGRWNSVGGWLFGRMDGRNGRKIENRRWAKDNSWLSLVDKKPSCKWMRKKSPCVQDRQEKETHGVSYTHKKRERERKKEGGELAVERNSDEIRKRERKRSVCRLCMNVSEWVCLQRVRHFSKTKHRQNEKGKENWMARALFTCGANFKFQNKLLIEKSFHEMNKS